jgi:biopolymer transport protein ExbB/TolQ
MNLHGLPELAGIGATLVLDLLIVLSVIQLAVIIERAIVFARTRANRSTLEGLLAQGLADNDLTNAITHFTGERSLAARVLASGASHVKMGAGAVEEMMKSRLMEEKKALESKLSFLGTLGNNAPFIGLFGTVLGIIRAFADLAHAGAGQASSAVMAGISEALVATAVGLLVALPAVVAYNAFMRVIKNRVTDAESLGARLLAHLRVDRAAA